MFAVSYYLNFNKIINQFLKDDLKKLTAALLILFYSVNTFGYLIFFFQQRKEIKNEMFSRIESMENLTYVEKISLNNKQLLAKNFNRFDEGEFEYLGKKYDIIKEIIKENETIFYCINDVNEEKLELALSIYIEENTNNCEDNSQIKI